MSAIGNFSTLLYCSQFSLCIYCESLQYLYLCLYTSDVCKHCLTCVTNYNTHVYNKTNWLLIIFPMKNPECDEWFLISSKLKIQLYSSWRLRKYVKYIKNYAGVPNHFHLILECYYNWQPTRHTPNHKSLFRGNRQCLVSLLPLIDHQLSHYGKANNTMFK